MAMSKKPMSEAQKAALAKARAALNGQKVSASATAPKKDENETLVVEVLELKRLLKEQSEQSQIMFNALMKQMDDIRILCQELKVVRTGSVTPDFLKKF